MSIPKPNATRTKLELTSDVGLKHRHVDIFVEIGVTQNDVNNALELRVVPKHNQGVHGIYQGERVAVTGNYYLQTDSQARIVLSRIRFYLQ